MGSRDLGDGGKCRRLAREAAKVLIAMSISLGILTGLSTCLLLIYPGLLTKDLLLWPIMRAFVPYMLFSLVCVGINVIMDGIQLASEDIPFMAASQFANMFLLILYVKLGRHQGVLSA